MREMVPINQFSRANHRYVPRSVGGGIFEATFTLNPSPQRRSLRWVGLTK